MKKLLIIDDDAGQSSFLESILCEDFSITLESDPLKALAATKHTNFNAILIDVHMPIMDGFEFIKKFRHQNPAPTPIFILSSDKSYDTRIKALNLEIKDFLYPEMSKEELIIRIKNHLQPDGTINKIIQYKDVTLDSLSLSVYVNRNKIEVTLTEYKILKFLISNSETFSDKQILKDEIWSNTVVMDKTLNSHLTNLRAKLSESAVQIKSDKFKGIILS